MPRKPSHTTTSSMEGRDTDAVDTLNLDNIDDGDVLEQPSVDEDTDHQTNKVVEEESKDRVSDLDSQTTYSEYIEEPGDMVDDVQIISNYSKMTEEPPMSTQVFIQDEFSHFGEFLSCQLRALPQAISIELMSKMHSQISEARIKALAYRK